MGRRSRKIWIAASIEAKRLKDEATLPPPPDKVQEVETNQSATVVSTSEAEATQRKREQELVELKTSLDKRQKTIDQQEEEARSRDSGSYPPRRPKRTYSDSPDAGPAQEDNTVAAPEDAQASFDAGTDASAGGGGSSSPVPLLAAAAAAFFLFRR